MLVYCNMPSSKISFGARIDDPRRSYRERARWTRISVIWVLASLLGLLGSRVDLRAQAGGADDEDKPAAAAPGGKVKKGDEEANWKAKLSQAEQALESNPEQAGELATAVANQINRVRAARVLNDQQKRLHEQALILKARALHAQKQEAAAKSAVRQLLAVNPEFKDDVGFPQGAEWIEQMRNSMGTVELSTVQSDVTVRVDGRVAAKIQDQPIQLTLLPGNHEITLEKEDYLPRPLIFSLMAGENRPYTDIQLRREFFKIPFLVNQPDVEIFLDKKTRGKTRPFTEVMPKLDPTLRDELLTFLENENINPLNIAFLLVDKVPLTDTLTFTFRKPCAVGETRTLELDENLRMLLNENPIFPLRRSVCVVELVTTEVSLSVDANLPNAQVYLNDESLGETPVETTVCPGRYTLYVNHEGGKVVREITVLESEDLDIEVILQPSLTFLGIYPSEFVNPEIYKEAVRVLSNTLKERVRFFTLDSRNSDNLEEYFKENELDLAGFIANLSKPKLPMNEIGKVAETLVENLDSNLILIGYFDLQEPSPTVVKLALFSKTHTHPDITQVDFRSPQDLTILINKIEWPERVADVFYEPWFGVKMIDTQIGDQTIPIIVEVQSGSPAKMAGLKPGDMLLQIDGQRKTTLETIRHLGQKKNDAEVRLNVRSTDGTERGYQTTVTHTPVEISRTSRDTLFNIYLAKLNQLLYEGPSDKLKDLAYFNMALIYMHFTDYKNALDILKDVQLEGTRGITQGTLLYYRGQCYEKLGDKAQARAAYQEALTFDASTIGSSQGPLVVALARERLNALK